MTEPLIVPGHAIDNPPTDDFWPHLDPGLGPVFQPDDGTPAPPYPVKDAKWFAATTTPSEINDSPMIRDPLVGITDSRVIVLGQPGVDSPPDRRLVTQFRLVCCQTLEWKFSRGFSPSMIFLNGMIHDSHTPGGGLPFLRVSLVLRIPSASDARACAQEFLRRTARQHLRLGLVDPSSRISARETEQDYLNDLAHITVSAAEREATIPFPNFRTIQHGEDFRSGGPDTLKRMNHQTLSAAN